MKKLHQSRKWKEQSRRRSRDEERRRQWRKLNRARWYAMRQLARATAQEPLTIVAPVDFDLLHNVGDCLEFFQTLHDSIGHVSRIHVDLSGVRTITTASLLYLISRLDHARAIGRRSIIAGNYPSDPQCAAFIEKSGFWRFVTTVGQIAHEHDPEYFEIVSGTDVASTAIQSIELFSLTHGANPEAARATYKAVIEAIGNTRNHAYSAGAVYRRWWLMAYRDTSRNKTCIAVLDNGEGIPETIRRRFLERIDYFDFVSHAQLIFSALLGENRSRTGELHRGKGLPMIYRLAKEGHLQDLIVLSRRGLVTCCDNDQNATSVDFRGTLLVWEIG